MSPKIAKEKAQRSLLLWVIICSVLVQTLAKCLVFKIPKEQKGRKWALALQQSLRCFWDQKQWKKRNSSSKGGPTPGDPHSEQAFLTWRAEEHFHTHISPELVKKATAKVACQEEGSGYISPEHSIVPGESDRPGRCSSRNSCFSKPYSIPHGGRAQDCLGGTSVQFLCPPAQTQHLWRYSGSGLTVFTEETKGNWTKSVFD